MTVDWAYHHRGIMAWLPEIWNLQHEVGLVELAGDDIDADEGDGYDAECANLVQVMKWCEEHLPEGDYFEEARDPPPQSSLLPPEQPAVLGSVAVRWARGVSDRHGGVAVPRAQWKEVRSVSSPPGAPFVARSLRAASVCVAR